jgi:imidazolonepropionase-like amidohydrolase
VKNTIAETGTINECKFASLVVLNKNPLVDINNTKTIEGVMLKGKWFSRADLDEMLKEVDGQTE